MDSSTFAQLDQRGIDWVRECLSNGEVFSKLVLSKLDIDSGTAGLLVTRPEHEKAIKDHTDLHYGLSLQPGMKAEPILPILVQNLQSLEDRFGPLALIGEEDMIYPSNESEKDGEAPAYEIDDRYLYIQPMADLKHDDELGYVLGGSATPWLNTFVIKASNIPRDRKITEVVAAGLASAVLGIINEAFDSMAYTLWLKRM